MFGFAPHLPPQGRERPVSGLAVLAEYALLVVMAAPGRAGRCTSLDSSVLRRAPFARLARREANVSIVRAGPPLTVRYRRRVRVEFDLWV